MGRYHHVLYLVSSLIDSTDLSVSVESLYFHSFQVSVSSKSLESVVDYLQAYVRSVFLSHRRFHSIRLMILFQLSGAVYQKSGRSDLSGHLGDLELYGLKLSYRSSELFSLLGVLYGRFIGPLSDT